MTYKEATPSCYRNYGYPDAIRKAIFESCFWCRLSMPCNQRTDFSERPRCGYIVVEAIEND